MTGCWLWVFGSARNTSTFVAGFSLCVLSLVAALSGCSGTTTENAPSGPAVPPLVLVGIDAGDWHLWEQAAGKDPGSFYNKLRTEGAYMELVAPEPLLSPLIWTSIATGVPPDEHGILDFVVPDEEGTPVPISSNFRRAPALWDMLGAAGRTTNVVGWLATWPAEPIQGALVSDRILPPAYLPDAKRPAGQLTFPAALTGEIAQFLRSGDALPAETVQNYLGFDPGKIASTPEIAERIRFFKENMAVDRSHADIFKYLWSKQKADLSLLYLPGLDRTKHLFMPFAAPQRDGVADKEFGLFNGVVEGYSRFTDDLLKELYATVGTEAIFVVVSDHGFKSGGDRPSGGTDAGWTVAPEWHRPAGVLAFLGPGVKSGTRLKAAKVLDVAPTLLALLGIQPERPLPGDVIKNALEASAFPQQTLQVAARRDQPVAPRPMPAQGNEETVEQLRSLGYVGGKAPQPANPAQPAPARGQNLPSTLQAKHNLAGTYISEGRYDKAIPLLMEVLKENKYFYPALVNLSNAYNATNQPSMVITLVESHLEEGVPEEFRTGLEMNLAQALHMTGRKEEALKHIESVEAREAPTQGLLNNKGILLMDLGRHDEAREVLRRGLELGDELDADILNNLARMDLKEGNFDVALQEFAEIRERFPNDVNSYMTPGIFNGQRENFAEAIPLLEKAVELAPTNMNALLNLGICYGKMGDYASARIQFQRVLALYPGMAKAEQWLQIAEDNLANGQ